MQEKKEETPKNRYKIILLYQFDPIASGNRKLIKNCGFQQTTIRNEELDIS